MDSDGACSDSGQSDHGNGVSLVSPQLAISQAAYYTKSDKIRDFLASKDVQAWVELAHIRMKVSSEAHMATVPKLCTLHW